MIQIAHTLDKLILIGLIFLMVLSVATPFIPTAKATVYYQYIFSGVINDVVEAPLTFLNGSNAIANITVHSIALGTGSVTLSSDYNYTSAYKPQYVSYDIIDNTTGVYHSEHREYWFNTNEVNETYQVFASANSQTYILSFLDYAGLLKTHPYIEAQLYQLSDASYLTVDKRPVDVQNVVTLDLQSGQQYRIVLSDGVDDANDIVYGNLTPSSVTAIQLVLRSIDFASAAAKQQLLLYQYVHTYAQRDFLNPTGAITVSYEDITSKTTSVTITITDNGTTVYTNTLTSQAFSDTWNNADNATSYEVTVSINHQTFGVFSFKQYLPGEYTKASAPFSLAFLGSTMGISTAVLLPALLIIFVAGCFSELTSEAAAIITVLIAILLYALGWIDIPQAAIISALALSVMSGIIAAKRRLAY